MSTAKQLRDFLNYILDDVLDGETDPKIMVKDKGGNLSEISCAFDLNFHDGNVAMVLNEVILPFDVYQLKALHRVIRVDQHD